MLKHVFDKDWHTVLPRVMALLSELARAESGLSYVEMALRYLASAARSLRHEDLTKAVKQIFTETGGALMRTMAQEWIAQGEVQATRESIFTVLEVRFGAISAAVATALAEAEDLPYLKTLLEKAATAESLKEFEKLLA